MVIDNLKERCQEYSFRCLKLLNRYTEVNNNLHGVEKIIKRTLMQQHIRSFSADEHNILAKNIFRRTVIRISKNNADVLRRHRAQAKKVA